MNIKISRSVRIRESKITRNGEILIDDAASTAFSDFIRTAYKQLGMAYPKFYKMDDLCKLGVVGAEILLSETFVIEKHGKEMIGLMIQNASSTFDTDVQYQSTIDDRNQYFPSPAVFVYTLPNIMLGEICIRHKIFGENTLFIEECFDPEFLLQHSDLLFNEGRMNACIAGWVEQRKEHYDAFLYLLEKTEDTIEEAQIHNIENINRIFKQS